MEHGLFQRALGLRRREWATIYALALGQHQVNCGNCHVTPGNARQAIYESGQSLVQLRRGLHRTVYFGAGFESPQFQ